MRRSFFLLLCVACAPWAWAQGRAPARPQGPQPGSRGERWDSYGHDGQRTHFQRFDRFFTLASARNFQLIWKMPLAQNGDDRITQPVVSDPVITTLGFRDVAVVADSLDNVWGVDIDLGKVLWHQHLKVPTPQLAASGTCAGGLTANPTFAPPVVFRLPRNFDFSRGGAAARGGARRGGGGFGRRGDGGVFGNNQSAYVLASDGSLHALAITDGYEAQPGIEFLPGAGAAASSLNLVGDVAYTTTSHGCGGLPNAVWAIDLATPAHAVSRYAVAAPGASTTGGVAIGTDGTIYAQSRQALLALAPKTLQLKAQHRFVGAAGTDDFTPTVFSFAGHDLVATASPDGRLLLLDAKAIAAAPVAQSAPLGKQIHGGLTTWEDGSGTRWLIAPAWNGTQGVLAGFKLIAVSGTPRLEKVWTSRPLTAPLPALVIHGVGFVLAGGESGGAHAELIAFNPATGAVLHASGDAIASWSRQSPSAANGFVYVTTHDGMLYQFGIRQEH